MKEEAGGTQRGTEKMTRMDAGTRGERVHVKLWRPVAETVAALQVVGEDVDPEQITRLLGCAPTEAHRKGEPATKVGQGVRRSGAWLLESRLPRTASLDEHIGELLGRVSAEACVWRELARFKPDILIGFFLASDHEVSGLSAVSAAALAERGSALEMDIWGNSDEGRG